MVDHSDPTCCSSGGVPVAIALNLFSFWRLLQNHTRITSLSMPRFSASMPISCADGLVFLQNSFSSALFTLTSMDVLFFRFRSWAPSLSMPLIAPLLLSASCSHLTSRGLSLHIFLKLSCKASKRQMVVWLNTFPYIVPRARPTSVWENPNLILCSLNSLANCSRSSDVGVSSWGINGSIVTSRIKRNQERNWNQYSKGRYLRNKWINYSGIEQAMKWASHPSGLYQYRVMRAMLLIVVERCHGDLRVKNMAM